jgi:translation initiation factor 6 (eIF-6)
LPGGLNERYLGVQYVIGTATMTAGKVTAGIVANKQTAPNVG